VRASAPALALASASAPPETAADRVWAALESDALGPDDLALRTGLPAREVLVALFVLETSGRARRKPGGRYERIARDRD
jgi:predicted Rossmann fold nucleotide-binding protein DprA/Smf involved in DNA uptake